MHRASAKMGAGWKGWGGSASWGFACPVGAVTRTPSPLSVTSVWEVPADGERGADPGGWGVGPWQLQGKAARPPCPPLLPTGSRLASHRQLGLLSRDGSGHLRLGWVRGGSSCLPLGASRAQPCARGGDWPSAPHVHPTCPARCQQLPSSGDTWPGRRTLRDRAPWCHCPGPTPSPLSHSWACTRAMKQSSTLSTNPVHSPGVLDASQARPLREEGRSRLPVTAGGIAAFPRQARSALFLLPPALGVPPRYPQGTLGLEGAGSWDQEPAWPGVTSHGSWGHT